MQFDRTGIVVRQRAILDIQDLALRVIRVHARPLFLAAIVGIIPALLINRLLLRSFESWDFSQTPVLGQLHYGFLLACLTVIELPLVVAPITLVLGRVMFSEPMGFRSLAGDLVRMMPQLLCLGGLVRIWPFLVEVILLERNPMRAKTPDDRSTLRRSRNFHRGGGVDLFISSIAMGLLGWVLALSLWAAMMIVHTLLVGFPEWIATFVLLYYPLSLWLVVAYLTVVRFLVYLDIRIRLEGWEVELMMRAEEARLKGQLS